MYILSVHAAPILTIDFQVSVLSSYGPLQKKIKSMSVYVYVYLRMSVPAWTRISSYMHHFFFCRVYTQYLKLGFI